MYWKTLEQGGLIPKISGKGLTIWLTYEVHMELVCGGFEQWRLTQTWREVVADMCSTQAEDADCEAKS